MSVICLFGLLARHRSSLPIRFVICILLCACELNGFVALVALGSDHGQRHCSRYVAQTYARAEHTAVRRQFLFRIGLSPCGMCGLGMRTWVDDIVFHRVSLERGMLGPQWCWKLTLRPEGRQGLCVREYVEGVIGS